MEQERILVVDDDQGLLHLLKMCQRARPPLAPLPKLAARSLI